MKRLIPWLLIPLAALEAASWVRISQLKNPLLSQGVLASRLNGTVYVAGGLSFDINGNVVLPPAPAPSFSVIVTKVTASTPNSFAVPPGKTLFLVFRNIPQALGEDYSIQGGNVVFNQNSEVDDIVQIISF